MYLQIHRITACLDVSELNLKHYYVIYYRIIDVCGIL
jgi:hypothetical protein